jgi:hypothetical protein
MLRWPETAGKQHRTVLDCPSAATIDRPLWVWDVSLRRTLGWLHCNTAQMRWHDRARDL